MRRYLNLFYAMVAVVSAGIVLAAAIGCCSLSAKGYRGPVSDHFNGERFRNQQAVPTRGFFSVAKWILTRDPAQWPDPINAQRVKPGSKPPRRVADGDLRVTFINHATMLIQVDGHNILTDPIYSERASPVTWAGPKRIRPPGIRFDDLPPIDTVIISHNHYDHMDLETLRQLRSRHNVRIFVGLGNSAYLDREGIVGAGDLDWWQTVKLSETLRLHAVPAQHFSNRGLCDAAATLWLGFVIESVSSGNIYFAGDTGTGPHFAQIRQRFGRIRLALLPIGAYLPRWFMSPVHISPAEAVAAHRQLGASTSVAMHFGTFPLADDAMDQPTDALKRTLARAPLKHSRFWVLGFGEGREVPPAH